MNTKGLFVVCIAVRSLFTYLAATANLSWLRIMGYLALLPALGFTYLFLSGVRNTGAFGQKVWWGSLRPIHALLYGTFAYFAILGERRAWIFLFLDTCIGLGGFLAHHSGFRSIA